MYEFKIGDACSICKKNRADREGHIVEILSDGCYRVQPCDDGGWMIFMSSGEQIGASGVDDLFIAPKSKEN